MMDEERERLLAQEAFYHVTLRSNLGSIKVKGLDPECSDCTTYRPWFKRQAVFLCTQAALADAKSMFAGGPGLEPHVVIKVAAKALLQHECDVDHSFPDRTKGLTFIQCLERVGYFVCY